MYFRHQLGITQEELGYRADMQQSYVSGVERASRKPNIATVDKIATALNVEFFELFIERREAMKMWTETFF